MPFSEVSPHPSIYQLMLSAKETTNKIYEVDKEAIPNVRGGGQALRISQLLRSAFTDASAPLSREGDLNHFSHRHSLLRLHLRESEAIKCNFCNIIISGRGYACVDHCDYYLHEVCTSFPREIRHDLHPGYDHTLMLKPFPSIGREQFHCAACGCDDHSLFHSYYCCELCDFNVHVECASIPIDLNQNVKFPLHLFLSFPITSEAAALSCSICAKVVPTLGCWLFYNRDHDYLCHFDCAAVTEYGMENDSMSKLVKRLQTLAITNRPPRLAGQLCGGITHFSHRHALNEYISDKPLSCSLCNFEFSTGFYCSGCNYFIDNMCFSIPSKIEHWSHPQHPLCFTCYLDVADEDLKFPGLCEFEDGGRAYYCASCKFAICCCYAGAPKTLSFEDNISYELFFSFPFKHEKAKIRCSICSEIVVTKDSPLYYNLERDDALHVLCALQKESCNDDAKEDMLSIQRLNVLRITD